MIGIPLLAVLGVVLLTGAASALVASESDGLPPLEYFFAESKRFAERISPDGKHVAFLGPGSGGSNQLWIVVTSEPETPKLISPADGTAITLFLWIGGNTLLWQSTGSDGRARLFHSSLEGAVTRQLLVDDDRFISFHGVANYAEPSILVGLSAVPSPFPDLYRVKLTGNAPPELVSPNRERIITWAWNGTGTPVAGLRWTADGAKEILKLDGGQDRVIFRAEPADDARLLFATLDGTRVLILTDRDSNFTQVASVDLTTGHFEQILVDPLRCLDIEQVIADERSREILAATYADETIRWQALAPGIAEMLATVNALPDPLNLTCLGFDANRNHYLLKAYADRDPGTVYLYDVESRSMRILWRERPEMERGTLSETEACDFPSRDGTRIPAYLTLPHGVKPPWPLVVFPHGGPRMRTSTGYDGRVQFLASRGYAVFQPNFRGSRGYGKAFMNAGDGQWGRGVMQTDVTDGVDFLIREGKVDKRRVAIFGGSYGGYAALAGLAFTPDHYAAGICLFGISDLVDYATVFPMEAQAYAGDTIRRLGDPSTAAGRALLEDLSPVNHAGPMSAPLLIYHGVNDTLIPASHARRMVAALEKSGKQVDYLLSPDEGHGFSHPGSEAAVYRAIEVFLHKHLGGSVGPEPAEPVSRKLEEFRREGRADPRN